MMGRLYKLFAGAALVLVICACAATGGTKGKAARSADTLPAAAPETLVTPGTAPDAVKAQAPASETAAPADTALLWSFETGG